MHEENFKLTSSFSIQNTTYCSGSLYQNNKNTILAAAERFLQNLYKKCFVGKRRRKIKKESNKMFEDLFIVAYRFRCIAA